MDEREHGTDEFRYATGDPSTLDFEILGEGDTIGPYRVERHLGDGAFGEVYLASQTRPLRRRVAVKLLKPGMDSRSVMSRFQAERQTLALMTHPGIATIHDAGVSDRGRSYFVMEYIDGARIDRFCDERRLTLTDRLALFGRVCDAVHHAHRRGVIHRDLKPSNLLVTDVDGRGQPKVIDFGIAKALHLDFGGTATEIGQFIGTPEFMAPEQTAITPEIDVRADVYSLGVVLYQLLCGRLPFDPQTLRSGGIERLLETVREAVPPRPSQRLAGLDEAERLEILDARGVHDRSPSTGVPRELDWIVMRCLEKDPARRYDNVRELARDLERFAEQRPIEAGPPSRRYRAAVFVRRNRITLAAAGAVLLTLAVGIVASTVLATRLTRERAANQVREVRELVDRSHEAFYTREDRARGLLEQAAALAPDDPDPQLWLSALDALAGRGSEALDRARRLAERYPDNAFVRGLMAGLLADRDTDGRRELGAEAERIGDDADALFAMSLGLRDDAAALELLDRSIELSPWSFLAVWQRSVRLYRMKRYEDALADAEVLTRVAPLRGLPWVLYGVRLLELERTEAARRAFQRAIELDPDEFTAHFNLALAASREGDWTTALEHARRATELAPDDGEAHELHATSLHNLLRTDEALAAFDRAIEAGYDVWTVRLGRVEALRMLGRHEEALAAIELVRPPDDEPDRWRALAWHGDLLLLDDRPAQAIEPLEQAHVLAPNVGPVSVFLARALRRSGRVDDAAAVLDSLGDDPNDPGLDLDRAIGAWRAGRIDDAVAHATRYVETQRDPWVRLWIRDMLIDARPAHANRVLDGLVASDDPDLARLAEFVAAPDPTGVESLVSSMPGARTADARYHAGAALLAAGHDDTGRTVLRRYVEGDHRGQFEHELARWKLGLE